MSKCMHPIFLVLFIVATALTSAQETVNGSDVNSFIIGGGQETSDVTLYVNAVSLVDVSPEGQAVIADGGDTLLEAGLPILASGTSNFIPDIWLNYTYRPINPSDQSEIYVRLSEPLPTGITLSIKVVEVGVGGNFIDRGVNNNFEITSVNKRIVKSFGAGYTDDGVTNGYRIEYNYTNNGSEELPPGLNIIYEILKI
ncbi:hypothetical protein ACFO5O_13085 [Geojedonia litorea]|uniref:Gliding motility-associated C-terminal domain-containing protein n=1 Tax=Geojedonia litorea TaxID=1268269 RepID=A0ABV9N703_9FLAO